MASGVPRWRPLPPFKDLPNLLISPNFTESSYTFHVTDLSSIWVETLDKEGIIRRTRDEATSIDLIDADPEDWAVFLGKINAAFDPTSPEYHLTSLSISAPRDGTVDDGLVLHVTCVLPRPFKPLKWPIFLTKCPPSSLASELVVPLIEAHHARAREADDLIARLKEKDAVITKLVDKLDALNTGLEHVFNSLSGKRKASRAAAEDKVKGLTPFNEKAWQSQRNTNRDMPQDLASLLLLRSVFGYAELQRDTDTKLGVVSERDDWWKKLGSAPRRAVTPSEEQTQKNREPTPPRRAELSLQGSDDDFQVQPTPPHLQSRKVGERSATTDASSDHDDSETEDLVRTSRGKFKSHIGGIGRAKKVNTRTSASQSSHTVPANGDETASDSDDQPVRPQPTKRANTRLGTIGKRKQPSPPPQKSSSPTPLPSKDDETATGSDSDEGLDSKAPSPPPKSVATKPRKPGLGRIGGNSKPTQRPSERLRATTPEIEHDRRSLSPVRTPGRKLGTIGKKPGMGSKRERPRIPVEVEEEQETEEQKAERKRAELAKELERKAAAPAKKRRRF
ncbi:XLF-domain-containing protein [Xylariomycetidae sp. FL2044]|nr:XLF-domain-containing protein [Xylariomycetidae sp. FL2044]